MYSKSKQSQCTQRASKCSEYAVVPPVALAISLCFHIHATQQSPTCLTLEQQAANQRRCHLLGGGGAAAPRVIKTFSPSIAITTREHQSDIGAQSCRRGWWREAEARGRLRRCIEQGISVFAHSAKPRYTGGFGLCTLTLISRVSYRNSSSILWFWGIIMHPYIPVLNAIS